jgi:uncharacterized protein (DUF362 family)
MDQLSRRSFLRGAALAGAQATLVPAVFAKQRKPREYPDLAVARGDSPARNCLAAVEALGGFARFVRPGARVAVKPNPVGNSRPEAAINTHPDMIEAVVRECLRVGARDVAVLSHDGMRDFIANGIRAAVERAGGRVLALADVGQFREVVVPRAKILRTERVAADVLDADVFINMPIAKHHAGSEVTLALKNLMGVNWDRLRFHQTDLHQCIAELGTCVRQDLVIMDANNVLMTNGPGGPGEVRRGLQVIAGTDPVAVDAFTARAYFRDPASVRHIRTAHELGVGKMDLSKLKVRDFEA